MVSCSFIQAGEARNLARNQTLIWAEICEVQTQILTAIGANLYSVLVIDGTPMTSTQGVLSTNITAGGTGYAPVVTTAVINAGGTNGIGATVTPTVTGTTITGFTIDNDGTDVLQASTVQNRGTGYSINDTLTVVGGTGTSATLTVTSLSTIASQDETAYSVFVGGDGAGGTAYEVTDVITLDDGSTITVDAIDVNGDVTQFTVASATTLGITGDLAVLSQLGTAVTGGAGNGVGFTMTQQLTNQGVFGVTIATAGAYTAAPASPAVTTVAPVNGTGATLNLTIGAGYAPVSVSATADTPRDLISGQDETDYTGGSPNGTFVAGDNYRVGEIISLVDGSTATVAAGGISATGVVSIIAQDETNFDGVGANGSFVGGDGAGGTAYVAADVITMSDGSTITVNAIDVNGDVTQFTIATASTASYTSTGILTQVSVSGLGNGVAFTITSDTNNEITVGGATLFDILSAGSTPFFTTSILQLSTDGIGTGFFITPLGNNAISIIQGTGVSLVVSETAGVITGVTAAGGSGYTAGATISFVHPTGINATASVASVAAGGIITGITVSNGGANYQPAVATVTMTAPGGLTPSLAFAGTVITTNGSVTGISIQEGGSGYAELLPTVSITDSTGTGATFTTNVAGGVLTAINIINAGSGYTAPTLAIVAAPTSGGTGATATATAGTNTFGTVPSLYNDVLTGQTTNPVILDQITFVSNYFVALGYNIRAQTNSTTMSTIQWSILW